MNTSEDTSTISCNAFSPARSTLGKNKIKCMTSNDVEIIYYHMLGYVFNISASGQSKVFVWLRCNALSIDPTFRPAGLLHFIKLFLAQFPGKKCTNTMKNNINFVKFNDLCN